MHKIKMKTSYRIAVANQIVYINIPKGSFLERE